MFTLLFTTFFFSVFAQQDVNPTIRGFLVGVELIGDVGMRGDELVLRQELVADIGGAEEQFTIANITKFTDQNSTILDFALFPGINGTGEPIAELFHVFLNLFANKGFTQPILSNMNYNHSFTLQNVLGSWNNSKYVVMGLEDSSATDTDSSPDEDSVESNRTSVPFANTTVGMELEFYLNFSSIANATHFSSLLVEELVSLSSAEESQFEVVEIDETKKDGIEIVEIEFMILPSPFNTSNSQVEDIVQSFLTAFDSQSFNSSILGNSLYSLTPSTSEKRVEYCEEAKAFRLFCGDEGSDVPDEVDKDGDEEDANEANTDEDADSGTGNGNDEDGKADGDDNDIDDADGDEDDTIDADSPSYPIDDSTKEETPSSEMTYLPSDEDQDANSIMLIFVLASIILISIGSCIVYKYGYFRNQYDQMRDSGDDNDWDLEDHPGAEMTNLKHRQGLYLPPETVY